MSLSQLFLSKVSLSSTPSIFSFRVLSRRNNFPSRIFFFLQKSLFSRLFCPAFDISIKETSSLLSNTYYFCINSFPSSSYFYCRVFSGYKYFLPMHSIFSTQLFTLKSLSSILFLLHSLFPSSKIHFPQQLFFIRSCPFSTFSKLSFGVMSCNNKFFIKCSFPSSNFLFSIFFT